MKYILLIYSVSAALVVKEAGEWEDFTSLSDQAIENLNIVNFPSFASLTDHTFFHYQKCRIVISRNQYAVHTFKLDRGGIIITIFKREFADELRRFTTKGNSGKTSGTVPTVHMIPDDLQLLGKMEDGFLRRHFLSLSSFRVSAIYNSISMNPEFRCPRSKVDIRLANCNTMLMCIFWTCPCRSDHFAVADSFPEPRRRKHADYLGRCSFNRYL